MSKKRKTNHLRAGRPGSSGRVTPRLSAPVRSDDFFDLDLDAGIPAGMITARFEKMGRWALPRPFLEWLDEQGLVGAFDDYAAQRRDDGTHGDAVTPFLIDHGADQTVIDDVRSILNG